MGAGLRCAPAGLGLVLLAACGTTVVEPELVDSPHFVSEDGTYTLELPVGWRRDGHALTREGWEHQTIAFNAGPVLGGADPVALDASAPGLLQALREQLESQPGVTVLACLPATFDGLAGFRLHFRRAAPAAEEAEPGLPREVLMCAAVDGATLYAFSYEAPPGEPFARDLAVFEHLLASFARRTAP